MEPSQLLRNREVAQEEKSKIFLLALLYANVGKKPIGNWKKWKLWGSYVSRPSDRNHGKLIKCLKTMIGKLILEFKIMDILKSCQKAWFEIVKIMENQKNDKKPWFLYRKNSGYIWKIMVNFIFFKIPWFSGEFQRNGAW